MGGKSDSPGDRVKVVVRVRPLAEHDGTDSPAVTCDSDNRRVQVATVTKEGEKTHLRTRAAARAYEFDSCIDSQTTQVRKEAHLLPPPSVPP